MKERKIVMVSRQSDLHHNQEEDDLVYWLSRPIQERLQAVTMLIRQNMSTGQRMDKTVVSKRNLK